MIRKKNVQISHCNVRIESMREKYNQLKRILTEYGKVAVAYSSGVDSTFLLKVARDTLGRDNVLAVTVNSAFLTSGELAQTKTFVDDNEINHIVINVSPLSIKEIVDNPPDRCYFCKKEIFSQIIRHSREYFDGCDIKVLEGSNIDDLSDYRPGMKAIAELSDVVRSPLKEAGLTKAEIRELSKELGLSTWDKPSAACLASRIAYGDTITVEKLRLVEEAEKIVKGAGYLQSRVRIHGKDDKYIARIEIMQSDIVGFISDEATRNDIYDRIKKLGFAYVTLDLGGYRMGSMNETININ